MLGFDNISLANNFEQGSICVSTETDPDLIELAMRLVKEAPKDPLAQEGEAEPTPHKTEVTHLQQPLSAAPATLGLLHAESIKEKKSPDELAAMILADLQNVEGCPKAGVNVTVYGLAPWNSWLSFGTEAGPVRNKSELQGVCVAITERLKRLYAISF